MKQFFFALSLSSLPLVAIDSVVVFNEIHYHPAEDDSSLEYIELYNQLAVDVDLSNWRVDGDITFDFPEGVVLGGGEYLVIAKDPTALSAATGMGSALGPYDGFLSNSGNPVILYNNNRSFSVGASPGVPHPGLGGRRIMDLIDFSDTDPWPQGPDGSGFTLAKIDASTATRFPRNWRASDEPNGSPGSENTFADLPTLSFNEISSVDAATFQIEIHNRGASSISLEGMVVASSDPAQSDYLLPASSLGPGQFLIFNTAILGFTPNDNSRLFFYTAGKGQLIDTIRVDNSAQARFPDGDGPWLRPTALMYRAK